MPIIIRQETAADYSEVYDLVKISFATSSYSDGTEPDYLNQLREKETFIPELSLVAENDDGKIVGQIVLYRTIIKTTDRSITELLLSPICVHPDFFRTGIARMLTDEACKIAGSLGYKAVFLCGDPELYKKLGFKPTYEYQIYHVSDRKAEWSMVRELEHGYLRNIKGTIDTI